LAAEVKPQPDRLYGRARGHKLRPRQEWLLAEILPQVCYPAPFGAGGADLWLEIGFGGGEHAEAIARANPGAKLIAAEVFENGICSLLSRLVPEGADAAAFPGNLRLWAEDARKLIGSAEEPGLLGPGALGRVFLLFPDPWPKARHAKRRFVHPATIAALARVIRPGGEWRIASDDPTYQAWVDEVLAGQSAFRLAARATQRPEGWPPTRYEAKAIAAGRQPVYWTLVRV
jgi:tRNA (guanine-N7-)-methyltransferase